MKRNCSIGIGMVIALAVSLPALADVELTVYSVPAGASVTEGSTPGGMVPMSIRYPTKGGKKGPCVTYDRITVTWPSGAHASTAGQVRICESAGKKQTIVFNRPAGVAGAELDFQYAVQLEQLDLMRRQMLIAAYSAISQQNAAAYQAQQQTMQQYLQSIQNTYQKTQTLQNTLSCTSSVVGTYIYTNCQ